VLEGWQALLEQVRADSQQVETIIHGTTLITNALIERKGATTALICTRGFRDILEMRREMRYDIYDLLIVLPEPLVPRPLRLEVTERVNWQGEVITPLAPNELETLKPSLQENIRAIAVCLMNAFAHPHHERRVGEWLRANFPQMAISLSSDVSPEMREYERLSTTVCNAYVQPLTERYLAQLTADLQTAGFRHQLYLMLSSGGITTTDTGARFPIRLVESGPAGGALAAVRYGEIVGERDLVSLDVGGTTAKICLIKDGQPSVSSEFEIARVHRFKQGSGLPVRVPTIELIEIGAGGGSIARVDALGLIKVGPQSAGADPGPACYGFGGASPTVTDAALLLGYLNPDYFLGGRMKLETSAAETAVKRAIAEPMQMTVTDAAHGIFRAVNENMISATRVHIAERGADARQLMLIAFGGAGPIHVHQIARALKMKGYICPVGAGVVSAWGFLTAPKAFDFARTHVARLTQDHLPELDAIFGEMEAEGRATLVEAGVPAVEMRFIREADVRHVGQGHEITIPLPYPHLATVSLKDELQPGFYAYYESLYGHAHRHLDVEIVTCRLKATGPRPTVGLKAIDSVNVNPIKGHRRVFHEELGGFVDTPVYDRYALSAGMRFDGPAIVEERDSTAVIGPHTHVRVDAYANLLITLNY
jgi:N-methylhydantoinase A